MDHLVTKVSLITGTGQGIGRAITRAFAEEGAKVLALEVVPARPEVVAGEAHSGGEVAPFAGDVTSRADVHAAIQHCVERFSGLNVLGANAGELGDSAWHRMLEVNQTGTLYCLQKGARVVAPRRAGTVMLVTSTNAFWGEYQMAHYNASKGGVVALVRSAAIDLTPLGIRVNAIEPGVVNTLLAAFVVQDPQAGAEYRKRIPVGRFQEPGGGPNCGVPGFG